MSSRPHHSLRRWGSAHNLRWPVGCAPLPCPYHGANKGHVASLVWVLKSLLNPLWFECHAHTARLLRTLLGLLFWQGLKRPHLHLAKLTANRILKWSSSFWSPLFLIWILYHESQKWREIKGQLIQKPKSTFFVIFVAFNLTYHTKRI